MGDPFAHQIDSKRNRLREGKSLTKSGSPWVASYFPFIYFTEEGVMVGPAPKS